MRFSFWLDSITYYFTHWGLESIKLKIHSITNFQKLFLILLHQMRQLKKYFALKNSNKFCFTAHCKFKGFSITLVSWGVSVLRTYLQFFPVKIFSSKRSHLAFFLYFRTAQLPKQLLVLRLMAPICIEVYLELWF